ncbi:uncharacterized protein MKK02DRAFT_28456 [Dioszegia hungarica]|uniref:Uncharacterized protein n=1 Tax=Dioszegia hungarica TaxID=4972 RepID=A0AA38H6T7_9TREE|nr:uncharacterized protein MKK02DRAFT_28456 [Dioszegia hungarica]KAI9633664.1 hypothetical protein MKK02DRAFT_28456 [Dioszegia hungarica]
MCCELLRNLHFFFATLGYTLFATPPPSDSSTWTRLGVTLKFSPGGVWPDIGAAPPCSSLFFASVSASYSPWASLFRWSDRGPLTEHEHPAFTSPLHMHSPRTRRGGVGIAAKRESFGPRNKGDVRVWHWMEAWQTLAGAMGGRAGGREGASWSKLSAQRSETLSGT